MSVHSQREGRLVIETRSLTKHFESHTAVDSVNLTVQAGQIYGFLGPNGAGKTTTIRMLLGLLQPDVGEIYLFDESLSVQREAILARVGSLIEAPSFYPNLTGRENLDIARRLLQLSSRRVDEVLDSVNLLDAADRRADTYSMGMKQRLGLAKALLNEPDLLILDEPANGMDPAGIREMRDWMTELPARTGVTIFMSSHILSEVQAIATHVGIIRAGKLIFNGAMADLRDYARPVLRVKTSDNERAQTLLESRFSVTGTIQQDDNYLLIPSDMEQAGLINQHLVEAGLMVHELYRHENTLEDVFFQITDDSFEHQYDGEYAR